MFEVGDYLVYKKDVCKVKEMKKQFINGLDYFVLSPTKDKTLKIEIPTNSKQIRKLLTKEQVEQIIEQIPYIAEIDIEQRLLESEYKRLLNTGSLEDLIRIIKTTYQRNQNRLKQNKKVGDKDQRYFEEAEKYLYQEFGIVLQLSEDETKEYIKNKIKK